MNIDLTKLSPAPFTVCKDSATVCDIAGGAVAHFFQGTTPETKAQAFRDAHSYALVRNAFDVMLRRGWYAIPAHMVSAMRKGLWTVMGQDFPEPYQYHPDPFTALVEADRWYRENVEAVSERGTA